MQFAMPTGSQKRFGVFARCRGVRRMRPVRRLSARERCSQRSVCRPSARERCSQRPVCRPSARERCSQRPVCRPSARELRSQRPDRRSVRAWLIASRKIKKILSLQSILLGQDLRFLRCHPAWYICTHSTRTNIRRLLVTECLLRRTYWEGRDCGRPVLEGPAAARSGGTSFLFALRSPFSSM